MDEHPRETTTQRANPARTQPGAAAPAPRSAPSAIRTPVKRLDAETNILISLVCFGLTVALTRIFLEMTGYPQIGNSVLHIAHALWGGLLLFIASLVTLTLANRWALTVGAVCSGVGVGLFIDEVGKFITQKNDYFFPPAAPLIYASFLLMVLLFLFVRRERRASARASMYRAVLGLAEVLDDNLDPLERDQLLEALYEGRNAQEPHIARLADQLIAYLGDDSINLVAYEPSLWVRLQRWLRALGERLGARNYRFLIALILFIQGVTALLATAYLIWALVSPTVALALLAAAESKGELTSQPPMWLLARIVLQALVGLLCLLALWWLGRGRVERAIDTALLAFLLSATVVALVNFYLNQFAAMAYILGSLGALAVLLSYRAWHLAAPAETALSDPFVD